MKIFIGQAEYNQYLPDATHPLMYSRVGKQEMLVPHPCTDGLF
jgi:hypothetical protein